MTKIAYLECPTGLAGDMCLGALVHAGVPLAYLIEKLSLLGITDEFQLRAELVHRNGQQATKIHVELAAQPAHEPPTFAYHFADPNKSLSVSSPTHSPTDRDAPTHPHPSSHPNHHHRHLPEIEKLITSAPLPDRAKAWSLAVFRRLAEAEGTVHGISPDQVHFHEVGATDAIVDIVGTCLGLDWLEIDALYCSALPIGGGTVRAAHGLLPVPVPATLKLFEIRQVPLYSNGIQRELVTPTGAAIVTTLATQFGPPPLMTLQRVGLGAGSQSFAMPNILRLWLGHSDQERQHSAGENQQVGQGTISNHQSSNHQSSNHQPEKQEHAVQESQFSQTPSSASSAAEQEVIQSSSHVALETVAVLETQIDDSNPQAIGYLFEVLFAAGALDVFTQAIGMKKSRPGILLTVICPPTQVYSCESVIFRETTTLGIRQTQQQRSVLHREFQTVQTLHGEVRLKVARQAPNGAILNVQPEYEDCVVLAQQTNIPWREIHHLALYEWYNNTLQKLE